MAYDYSDDLAFAQEAIAEFGRTLVLIKEDDGIQDNNNPLGAPGLPTEVPTIGVFVEPTGLVRLGASTESKQGLFKDSDKIAIIAADGVNDFETFTKLRDGFATYKVVVVHTLAPGDTALLYYVGVKR